MLPMRLFDINRMASIFATAAQNILPFKKHHPAYAKIQRNCSWEHPFSCKFSFYFDNRAF